MASLTKNSEFAVGRLDLQLDWFSNRKIIHHLAVYELHMGDFAVNLDPKRTRAPHDVNLAASQILASTQYHLSLWAGCPDKHYNRS